MQYICKQILQELDEDHTFIDLNTDPLYSNERGILYKCIQKVVEFNIDNYSPQLHKFNANTINDIVKVYYDTYNRIDITNMQY